MWRFIKRTILFLGAGVVGLWVVAVIMYPPPSWKGEGEAASGGESSPAEAGSDTVTVGELELSPMKRYKGEIRDGKPNGQGVLFMTSFDGDEVFDRSEGEFRDGKLHGQGFRAFSDGEKYAEGEFRNGKLHGQGVALYVFPSRRRFHGEFREGKPAGRGVVVWEEGMRYEGEVNDLAKPHGRGVMDLPNGDRYEGEWSAVAVTKAEELLTPGLPHGQGVMTFADGTRLAGTWIAGEYAD